MKMGLLLSCIIILTGCASNHKNGDPYENINRSVYSFNRTLDKAIVIPVTKGYQAVTPDPVEKGVSNFFSNIGDVGNMFNNIFQFKLLDAGSDFSRFIVNSTLGLAGLFDPASAMGLEKHDEDFGQTLGKWGVEPGAYVMLPFLGPSTARDTISLFADNYLDPLSKLEEDSLRFQLAVVRAVDKRASLLSLESQLKSALDEYSFIRDAYLQNRKYKVFDGNLPLDDLEDCDPEYEDC